jgi:lipoprotein-anchoring transpeptidase ErfK/SrfK
MNWFSKVSLLSSFVVYTLVSTGCVTQPGNSNITQTGPSATPTASTTTTPAADSAQSRVTLPVLDAFFASDENFAKDLKNQVGLTDEQVVGLRTVAREETAKLRETDSGEYAGTTEDARTLASKRIEEIVGPEKASQVTTFVQNRWQATDSGTSSATSATEQLESKPNAIPTDTRVVVNSPAYRMDVFENGKLVKSYKVGIGYPEFPLPTGLRKASTIIFNPSWTPPDEPWVESPTSKVRVGEKVEAGSKLNPLGVLKIPIGLPSLIHGGKSPAKLGTFASHGCVGLTDPLAQDLAKTLARLGGAEISDADINAFKKNRSETKQVKLDQPVPVELRYETIVPEDGKLHIYRDVYDRNTNTEENLRAVLEAQGVSLDDLSETERSQVMQALSEMSRDARGRNTPPAASASPSPTAKPTSGKVTRTVKGKKEVVIDVAALKGKGYPAMAASVDQSAKSKTQSVGASLRGRPSVSCRV